MTLNLLIVLKQSHMTPPILGLSLEGETVVLTCDKIRLPVTTTAKLLTRNFGSQKAQLVIYDGHITAPVHGGTLPASCWPAVGLPSPPDDADLRTSLEHLIDCVSQNAAKSSTKRPLPGAVRSQPDGDAPASKRARSDVIRDRLRELEAALEKELHEVEMSNKDRADPEVLEHVRQTLNLAEALSVGKTKHPRWQVGLAILDLLLQGEAVLVKGSVVDIKE
jgi:hypothetical protein